MHAQERKQDKRQTEAQKQLQQGEKYRREEEKKMHTVCFCLFLHCLNENLFCFIFYAGHSWLDMDPIKHEEIALFSGCVRRYCLVSVGTNIVI